MSEFDKQWIEPEWKEVIEEFPNIFLDLSDEVKERSGNVNLRYGFEMGIGWKEIVRGFCKDLENLIQMAKDKGHDIEYKACIMKEKFGEFRPQGDFLGEDRQLYMEDYFDIVDKWSAKSCSVCENTGEKGSLKRMSRIYKTLSDKEAERLGYK